MKTTVNRILRDLYRMDPALREQEDALRKVIQKLIDEKPEAHMNPAFEKELKDKLLATFSSRQSKEKGAWARFVRGSTFRWTAGLASAACLLIVVALQLKVGNLVSGGKAQEEFPDPQSRISEPKLTLAIPEKPVEKTRPAAPLDALAGIGSQETAQPTAQAAAAPLAGAPPAAIPSQNKDFFTQGANVARAPEAEGERARKEAKSEVRGAADNPMEITTENQETAAPQKISEFNTEGYDRIRENGFAETLKQALSTFSIDVDTASYSNVRRFLAGGSLPYPDAVRIEEMVNYFDYEYAGPKGSDPINLETELSVCPWNGEHLLLRVGLQAKRVAEKDMPPCNLVFLIDVSGSMGDENKLPLVKESMKLLVEKMRQEDRIAIVVYAGSAGLVLPSTSGDRKSVINEAIDRLESGGSTAGGEGILLAYQTAGKSYMAKGNNRVIIASDGDFNVGPSSDGELVRIIEEKRKEGVFLTVLGFGMGNYKDSKMQGLADSGNGNYAYIDSLAEAQKALVHQMAGTLFTIAKDVKIQIEFNPSVVGEYRLLGYENRMLSERDFADDTKDAGELGAGTAVTALYEIVPASGATTRGDLRYQNSSVNPSAAGKEELMLIKFRYKKPDGDTSLLMERPVPYAVTDLKKTSDGFRFAAAVAEWGLLLRDSEFKGTASFEQVEELARGARGRDQEGWRAEFIRLVALSKSLSR